MAVTLHTTQGDLKLEVFCDTVHKSSENFLALCAVSETPCAPRVAWVTKGVHRTSASGQIEG